MSIPPPSFSPTDSNELYDSITGELIYSSKKTVWHDSAYNLDTYEKLLSAVDNVLKIKGEIKINTPPPPSSTFLPRVYNLQMLALQDQNFFDSENSLSLS